MQVAARHVDEVANAIDAELRALDNRIQPITSSWRGAAASSYLSLHERWTQDATKLRQVLAEISQGLTQNATRYQTNEDDGRRPDGPHRRLSSEPAPPPPVERSRPFNSSTSSSNPKGTHHVRCHRHHRLVRHHHAGPGRRGQHRSPHRLRKSADLRQFIAPLVASWEGGASSDYQSLQKRWDTAAADLNAVLAQIGQLLGQAHDGYRATESANAACWG